MRAKVNEAARARELRALGWPLRRIANELDVSLSSVSIWTRDAARPAAPAKRAAAEVEPAQQSEAQLKLLSSQPMKVCGRCRRSLPLTEFNRHPKGHQHWCRHLATDGVSLRRLTAEVSQCEVVCANCHRKRTRRRMRDRWPDSDAAVRVGTQ